MSAHEHPANDTPAYTSEDMTQAWDEGYRAAHNDVERDEAGLGYRSTSNPYRIVQPGKCDAVVISD